MPPKSFAEIVATVTDDDVQCVSCLNPAQPSYSIEDRGSLHTVCRTCFASRSIQEELTVRLLSASDLAILTAQLEEILVFLEQAPYRSECDNSNHASGASEAQGLGFSR